MTRPIRPDEVVKTIPPEVIEIVNEMIKERWNGSSATIMQDDVVRRVCLKMKVMSDAVFDKGWLDFEDVFRAEGWKVTYDKPGYCEDYAAFFRFEKPR